MHTLFAFYNLFENIHSQKIFDCHIIDSASKQCTSVVYFDQHLGAAHSKCWLNYAFPVCAKKLKKGSKRKKFAATFSKKLVFEFAPECWLRVLFPEQTHFQWLKHVFRSMDDSSNGRAVVCTQRTWVQIPAPALYDITL